MNEILFEVTKAVVVICAMLLTAYIIPFLKAKVKESKYADLASWVCEAVKWAEQTFKGNGMGAEKKRQVLGFLTKYANDKGISITQEQLDVLIESAVNAMNKGKK